MAQDTTMDYGEIKESVKGMIFMGTPHLGSRIAAANKYLQDLANVNILRGVRQNLLNALIPKSLELTKISSDFMCQSMTIPIVSICEQNVTNKKILVSSALLLQLALLFTKAFRAGWRSICYTRDYE